MLTKVLFKTTLDLLHSPRSHQPTWNSLPADKMSSVFLLLLNMNKNMEMKRTNKINSILQKILRVLPCVDGDYLAL